MSFVNQNLIKNRLLGSMPASALGALQPYLEHVDLPAGFVLVEAGTVTDQIYFLESGLASITMEDNSSRSAEIGQLGFEGMSGTHILLTAGFASSRSTMQIAGTGRRIATIKLMEAMADEPAILGMFLTYLHTCYIQIAQTALSGTFATIRERLARSLLMTSDRCGDEFPITHEAAASRLGTRRASITLAMEEIEGMSAIKATRGKVRILDRKLLEGIAGASYGVPEVEYERLLGSYQVQAKH